MTNAKDKRIHEIEDTISRNTKAIEILHKLKNALEMWDRKNIDKTFFERFFLKKGENDTRWTALYLSKPQYSFQTFAHRIFITPGIELELESRETVHVLEKTEEMIERLNSWINEEKQELTKTEDLDEKALVKELIALYKKYNKPRIWQEVLDSYEVKYPKE